MNALRWLLTPLRWLCRVRIGGKAEGTLVVQPLQGIGDMIWQLPAIHAIAARRGAVTLLTKPRSQADKIFAGDQAVRDILWLQRNPGAHDGLAGLWRLARLLRRRRFAEAWLFHGSSRYALALMLAGIPVTRGYGRGLQRALLSDTRFLPNTQRRGHPLEMGAVLLALHGLEMTPAMSRLSVAAPAAAAVAARFATQPRPWIAFGIGSSEPYKQWGAKRFAELAAILLKSAPGTILLLGGPAESGLADDIIDLAALPGRIEKATNLPLDQTAALLAESAAYVGNDTGALNVAAAVGTDAVGLFGASEPLTYSDRIHPLVPESGMGSALGMDAITADQVVAFLRRIGLFQ